MADALVSIILEQLSSITAKELEREVRLVLGTEDEIEQLTTTLKTIKAVLEDAEEKQQKNELVKVWLEELRNVAYDMEDVLDEWSTEILRSQIEGSDKKKACSCLFSLRNCFGHASLRHNIGHKIKEIKRKLDVIAIEKDKYQLAVASGGIEEPQQHTTISMIDVLEVCGRTQDRDFIVSKLLSESSQLEIGVPVISIVGMGGIGKTTLAQLVFNDDTVKSYFEKRIWVCVSEPFDEIRIAKEIIVAVGEKVSNDIALEALCRQLCDSIRGKRFLLVLDDVWTEDHTKWDRLKLSINGGAQGSRILVTTRNERVAITMGSTNLQSRQNLSCLSEDDCWLLFSRIAFVGRDKEEREKLEETGKKIAKKCKGVPLSVKTLGSLLRFKRTSQDWQDVLESDTWELPEVQKDLLPALLLSYYALPPQLKRCLTYCSIFPKDFTINKDELIKLWTAQGLFSSTGRRELETVGSEIFDNLVMRSFFQNIERDDGGNIISCMMHDLVHDFAQFLTKTECSIIHDDNPRFDISNKVRHLTIAEDTDLDSTLPSFYKAKSRLRTLIVHREYNLQFGESTSDLFHRFTCLRTLSLRNLTVAKLPNQVEKLIHLRYFDLSGNEDLEELPETMTKLYNLQTLKLNECSSLCKLPQGIGKMINLRHLEIEDTKKLRYLPQGIGKLSSLRTLSKFIVGGAIGGGCEIGELKDLSLLRGDLKIIGLEGVADVNEANEAKLKNRQHLHGMKLRFGGYVLGNDQVEESERIEGVLEGLQPHENLKHLQIKSYTGSKFPSWMVGSMLPNLVVLELIGCVKCVQFPALGKFPFLEKLKIRAMDRVTKFTSKEFGGIVGRDGLVTVFPRLKEVDIDSMENLEEWDLSVEDEGEIIMPCLSVLRFGGFLELKVLPALGNLPVLESLEITLCWFERIGLQFLGVKNVNADNGTKRGGGESTIVDQVAFPHLKKLSLKFMSELEEWDEMFMEDVAAEGRDHNVIIMPCLHALELSYCWKLKKLPHQIFPASLRELEICQCPKLTWTPCLPPLLEKLTLNGEVGVLSTSLPIIPGSSNHLKSLAIVCSPYSVLPQGLAHLTALRSLDIMLSDSLMRMSEELRHLTSLRELSIWRCPVLEERCRKEVGEDWSIISHIPKIIIGAGQIQ